MESALILSIGDMIGIFLVVGLLFAFAVGMGLTFAYQAVRYWPAWKRKSRESAFGKEGAQHAATQIPRQHPRAA